MHLAQVIRTVQIHDPYSSGSISQRFIVIVKKRHLYLLPMATTPQKVKYGQINSLNPLELPGRMHSSLSPDHKDFGQKLAHPQSISFLM
jgi:hypothetical protein